MGRRTVILSLQAHVVQFSIQVLCWFLNCLIPNYSEKIMSWKGTWMILVL